MGVAGRLYDLVKRIEYCRVVPHSGILDYSVIRCSLWDRGLLALENDPPCVQDGSPRRLGVVWQPGPRPGRRE
jgi:hypothetical protein